MKIIKSSSFNKLAAHLNTHPPVKVPVEVETGSGTLHDEDNSKEDVKKKWKRKKRKKTDVKLPYQNTPAKNK